VQQKITQIDPAQSMTIEQQLRVKLKMTHMIGKPNG
jgi:hypothetical protein